MDADLRNAVPEVERELAERLIRAPEFRLPAGRWDPGELSPAVDAASVVLILNGLLRCEMTVAATPTAHLFGPGELLLPWEPVDSMLPIATRWSVGSEGAEIVVLGEAFRRAEQRWPQLAVALQRRFAEQAAASAVRAATMSLPRVEHRIIALFWQLAERWGTVHPDGIRVHLKLTHGFIGLMTGAKRPTVTLALGVLSEIGALRTDDSAVWRLSHDSSALAFGSARSMRDGPS